MNVEKRNDVAVYCLSTGPMLPEWLGERARRNLSKRDESVRRRIELIQDFQMPSSSSKIIQSPDGRYIIASGTYPPRIRCYDVHDLTMKFERYVNAHVLDMAMLGEDYGKFALLLGDRSIAFHAPYGAHESIRIPTFGRGMAYESTTCELLVAAKGNRIFRVNLEEGRFSEPWTFESNVSATSIGISSCHPLAALGCDDGKVRFWDNRSPDTHLRPFLKLDTTSALEGYGYAEENQPQLNTDEISAIEFDPSGLYLAAGTAGGLVALYDVRSSKPLHIKEHKQGVQIHTVRFHPGSGCVLSSDEKLVKAWRYKASDEETIPHMSTSRVNELSARCGSKSSMGSVLLNLEGSGKLAHFITAGDDADPSGHGSGLLLCASDQPKMESFYIPALGLAPKWCSFLENITEELEENDLARQGTNTSGFVREGQEAMYENYKFVSRDDVEKLGLSKLVGTPLLRGYMHGFFMDINLYNRVRAVANPFEYEEYRKKKLKERIEAKTSSRIAMKTKSTKSSKVAVNPDLADRLRDKATMGSKGSKVASTLLADERFGSLFTDPDFQINEEDENFKLRNPSGVAATKQRQNDIDSDDDDGNDGESEDFGSDSAEYDDSDHGSIEDEDGFIGAKVVGEVYKQMKYLGRPKGPGEQIKTRQKRKSTKKKRLVYEAEDMDGVRSTAAIDIGLGDASASDRVRERVKEMNLPLAKRMAIKSQSEKRMKVRTENGSKQSTYIPNNSHKKVLEQHEEESRVQKNLSKRKRRGVKELGFRDPFRNQN